MWISAHNGNWKNYISIQYFIMSRMFGTAFTFFSGHSCITGWNKPSGNGLSYYACASNIKTIIMTIYEMIYRFWAHLISLIITPWFQETTVTSNESSKTTVYRSAIESRSNGVPQVVEANGAIGGIAKSVRNSVLGFFTPSKNNTSLPAIVESSESGFEEGNVTGKLLIEISIISMYHLPFIILG